MSDELHYPYLFLKTRENAFGTVLNIWQKLEFPQKI